MRRHKRARGSRTTTIAAKSVNDAIHRARPKRFSGSSWWQIRTVRARFTFSPRRREACPWGFFLQGHQVTQVYQTSRCLCYNEEQFAFPSVRILFLSPRQCWPTRSGAKLREYHFLRALAQRGQVTYLHFTDPDAEPLTRKDLPFCQEVVAIPKPPAYGPAKLVQGVFGRWPLPILNYTSAEMSAAVDRLTSTDAYDLVHLDLIHMIRYGEAIASRGERATRIVYNWHNIESELMRRFGATASSPVKRWYAHLTARKLASLEQHILKTAFGHVVCSDRELEELRRIAPSARIAVIENGVDVASFSPGVNVSGQAHKLVFVGLMNYSANVEAATSFTQRIWPLLRQRFPDLELWIVGASPTSAVLQLGNVEGVTVTGTVPDVRPYYRDALAAIVPLRTGGGTRLKILEAMAAGVPVVSTPLGAEGLSVTPGENILMAEPDDAETWLRHLEHLKESEPGRRTLSAAALELVRTSYDWEMLGRKLCDTYEAWLRDSVEAHEPPEPPGDHRSLQHHRPRQEPARICQACPRGRRGNDHHDVHPRRLEEPVHRYGS